MSIDTQKVNATVRPPFISVPPSLPPLPSPPHLVLCRATEHGRQLCYDVVESQVPGLPHWVLEGGREGGVALGGAVVRAHDPLCQEVVTEERGH